MVWCFCLSKNFPQFVVIHTVKEFNEVKEAKEDILLEFPCFLYNPMNVGIFTSGFSAFSKHRLYVCKFLVHVLLKNFQETVWRIWGITLLACEMSAIVQ